MCDAAITHDIKVTIIMHLNFKAACRCWERGVATDLDAQLKHGRGRAGSTTDELRAEPEY